MKFRRPVTGMMALAVFAAVVWLYYWTVGSPKVFHGQQADYYNLLVDGFQDGLLAMKATPDPMLGVDHTKVNGYLLDASFYKGSYYLYFGVTPALLLFWPWTLVTGHDLPESLAVMLLAGITLALSMGWLRTMCRSFFPPAGGFGWVVSVLMLGLGTGYVVVLRRPLFYEVAIFSGVASSMGCLWCLTLTVLRRDRSLPWLTAASLCAGLAAGSRPTLVPGAMMAVGIVAVWIWWRERRQAQPGPAGSLWRAGLAAGGPLGLMLAGLAWYNWARFENPFEFGLHHQVGSNGNGFPFTFSALWHNLALYYFTPPNFSWFFPFFSPGSKPLTDYQEQVHGQFFWLPWFVLAGGSAAFALWRRKSNPDLVIVTGAALAWAGAGLIFVCMAPPHSNRYQLDFHPVLVVLALLGLFAGVAPRWRWIWRVMLGWSAAIAVCNLCASFHVHGFFRTNHPAQYEALARVADRLVWPLHQLAGPRLGGLEVVVKFPRGTPGAIEPLLVAGGGPDMDALLIRYTAPGMGRLVFVHLGQGEVEGPDFDLQEGRARWMKIHLGTLYPPPWHPWYDSLPPDMARAANHVSVKIDDVEVLQRDAVCFQASANQVALGQRAGFSVGAERFSGEIDRVRGLKADQVWLQALKAQKPGTLRLRLELPRDRFGAEEPLVMTGERGRTESVSITYVRDGVVRFSVFHAGWPVPVSSPDIEWDYRQHMEVLVGMGSLRPGNTSGAAWPDGVTVETDGRIVLGQQYTTHPARPTQVYLGCIPWPLAGSRMMFGGQIWTETAEDQGEGALRRAKQSLLAGRPVEMQLVFPGRTGNQPVFTTGITGRGDGLFVEYLSATEVRFGFDHWGSQPHYSPPVTVEPGRPHVLKVSFGVRVSNRMTVPGRLEVTLDGRPVFDLPVDLFQAEPDQVFFGANPIGMSTSGPVFAGKLEFPSGMRREAH